MNASAMPLRYELRLLAAACLLVSLPTIAATAAAQSSAAIETIDPVEIDRAVSAFTGVETGGVGGARLPADRRLRLSKCASPLNVSWYGRNRSTLQVSCAGPETWRIFVATRPVAQEAESMPVVTRGDPITVQVRGRGFSVQQAGEALENGGLGDWIGIRTSREATPIRARIERPGLAVVPVG